MPDRVLIVDDDPDIVRFVQVNLELEGFEVSMAKDGEDALLKVESDHPDLVLLDVMMPKMDGFEVCARLRADDRWRHLPIIMLTARTLSSDKVSGLTAGADDYIIKPFDPLELAARVKTTLRRAREMRDLSPLTGLSGNAVIVSELNSRITNGRLFALMHVDLDNFKAYNDHYGFARGDIALKETAGLLRACIEKHPGAEPSFLGHIGGDDFAIICDPTIGVELAEEIVRSFDESVPSLYDPEDLEAGYIVVTDRRSEPQKYPMLTISLGIANNLKREIHSHLEASAIANEMKHFSKMREGSSYSVDRRAGL